MVWNARRRPILLLTVAAVLAALLGAGGVAAAAPVRPATPSPAPAGSSQLVTVNAPAAGSSHATLSAWQRAANGSWTRTFGPVAARVGGAGIGHAREGSDLTPAGTFPLTQTFGRLTNPGTRMPYFKTDALDWWDENPASPTYNLHVRQAGSPGAASENLYRSGTAYDYAANIGYNLARTPGAGSAFFLHVNTGSSTAGCVSIDEGTLAGILRWLDPAQHPYIDIRVGGALTPTAAAPPAPPLSPAQAGRAVTILFPALLGHPPNTAAYRHETAVLTGGMPPATYAGILATSAERRHNVVVTVFRQCLGRDPDPSSLATYAGELGHGGTLRMIYAQICRSDAAYRHLGGTDAAYLQGLSRIFAGAADHGAAVWSARLHSWGRSAVVDALATYPAFRVAQLDALYTAMLGRHVDASGINSHAPSMSDRGVFTVPAAIAGSSEFRRRLG